MCIMANSGLISGKIYVGVSIIIVIFSTLIIRLSDATFLKFSLFYMVAIVFFIIGLIRIANEPKTKKKPLTNHSNHKRQVHDNQPSQKGHQQLNHNTNNQINHHVNNNMHNLNHSTTPRQEIKQCPTCGAVHHAHVRFCSFCGFRYY